MSKIWTEKQQRKADKKLKRKQLFFALFKLRRMRNVIKKKIYSKYAKGEDVKQIGVYAFEFKKLSQEQIEYGLNLFVKRGELLRYDPIIYDSKDCYKLTLPDLTSFNDVALKEIDLSDPKEPENLEQIKADENAEEPVEANISKEDTPAKPFD